MKPTYFDAVHALVGGGVSGPTNGNVQDYQFKDGQTPPTEKAIQAKLAELQAEYESKQYQRDRADSYPKLGDQLDMLFHAIDAGKVDKTSDFYKSLKAVKDKYPKG